MSDLMAEPRARNSLVLAQEQCKNEICGYCMCMHITVSLIIGESIDITYNPLTVSADCPRFTTNGRIIMFELWSNNDDNVLW